jgi:Carboxypeptidase regulatory-like domain
MRIKLTCFAALLVLFSSVLHAQEFRATITGRITDASGAVIAGAKIEATNQATNEVASTVSDSSGIYTIPLLQPGTYTVTANATGFKSYVHANIALNTGDRTGVDIQMEVGEVQQTVTVSAETPPIDTQTATLGFVVNTTDVTEIPLNGRNPYMLASLSPSVNYMGSQQFQRPFDNGAIAEWSINGGLSSKNEFLLDGAPNNAQAGGDNLAWVTPVDSVSQFKVQTTTYDAEYGKTAGGIVNLTTKAGTDEFHGTVYEFLRRTPLDAVPPADAAVGNTSGVPVDYLNQYGFSIGGPAKIPKVSQLLHGKTFFFANYEKYYQDNPQAENSSVPTMQELGLAPGETGVYDFSGLDNPATDGGTPITIYNPFPFALNAYTPAATITTNSSGQTSVNRPPMLIANPFYEGTCPTAPSGIPAGTFSCNTTSAMIQGIPSNVVNPIALAIAKLFPAANQNGVTKTGATRYGTNDLGLSASANPFLGNGEDHFYNFIARADQDFGQKDHVFFRFGADDRHQQSVGAVGITGVGTTGQNPLIRANYAAAADWTRTINPTLITDLRVSESQYVEASDSTADAGVTPATLGFASSVVSQIHYPNAFGIYGITNYTSLGKDIDSTNYTNTFAIAAKVMKVHGAHSFKVGADLRWIQENFVNVGNNFDLSFADNWTECVFPVTGNCPVIGGNASAQGDGLASMLLGLPTSFESDNLINPSYLTRYFAGYFQDDWRVNSKLSLNLGIRYDVHPPVVEGHDALTDGWAFGQVNPINTSAQTAFANFTASQLSAYNSAMQAAGLPTSFPTLTGGVNYVNGSGHNADITDWTGIQPRFGMAYQVNQKLVFRAGWARYIVDPTNDWYQNPPPGYNQNTSFSTTTGLQDPAYTAGAVPFGQPCATSSSTGCATNLLTNPFAVFGGAGIPQPTGNALQSETLLGQAVNFFNPRFHLPWVSEFSAGIQYALPKRSRIEITYVGNRGYKLETNNTYNVIPLALRQKCDPFEVLALNPGAVAPLTSAPYTSQGPAGICNATVANPFYGLSQFGPAGTGLNTPTIGVSQLALPFPEFGSGTESGLNLGKLWYNGLVVTYSVRATSDLTLTVAYTWSNTVEQGGYSSVGSGSNANTDASEAYIDVQRGILEQSAVPWNIPNVVTISGVYQLPFGKGKRFAGSANRFVDWAIGGWEYNINALYQAGRPWNLPTATSTTGGIEFFPNGMNGSSPVALPVSWKGGPNVIQGVRPCVGIMSNTGVIAPGPSSTANGNPYDCTATMYDPGSGASLPNYNFLELPTSFTPISLANQRTTLITTQPALTANMSLAKTFAITERFKFQFRAEAFNAFNTPWLAGTQFSNTLSSASFGTITKSTSENGSAFQNREIQLGFKLIF